MKNIKKMTYPFSLSPLKFSYEELMPYMDAKTVDIHYNKHHAGYVDHLNDAIKEFPELYHKSLKELLSDLSLLPESIRSTVETQGGGHANHTLFWDILKPEPMSEPSGELAYAIKANFKSFENFRLEFCKAVEAVFASGWVVLIKDFEDGGKLKILTLKNHENIYTLGSFGKHSSLSILICDVWEHAYYLNYQNRRSDYVAAFWNLVDWHEVESRFNEL